MRATPPHPVPFVSPTCGYPLQGVRSRGREASRWVVRLVEGVLMNKILIFLSVRMKFRWLLLLVLLLFGCMPEIPATEAPKEEVAIETEVSVATEVTAVTEEPIETEAPTPSEPSAEYSSEPLSESMIFMAEGIKNEKIQFIWLEIPTTIKPGKEDVRLFLAKTDLPEPTIPNPNELRCMLSSEDETAILGPERIPFEFKEDGTFSGSYTYKACPECIECYMNWDYTLEMTGTISGETVVLDIAIKHFGHNVQGSYVNAQLERVSNSNKEPRISCNRMIECQEIVFVNR